MSDETPEVVPDDAIAKMRSAYAQWLANPFTALYHQKLLAMIRAEERRAGDAQNALAHEPFLLCSGAKEGLYRAFHAHYEVLKESEDEFDDRVAAELHVRAGISQIVRDQSDVPAGKGPAAGRPEGGHYPRGVWGAPRPK